MVAMIVAVVVIMAVTVMVTVNMAVIMGMALVFVGANAFDMMMMAFLRQADFVLETQYLFAVFAHLTIHVAGAFLNFDHSVDESLQHQRLRV